MKRGAIQHRLATGRLHRFHHGIYLVGHPAAHPHTAALAALLSCGERAAISHGSAVALWDLIPSSEPEVEVTVSGWNCRRGSGIRVHRVRELDRLDRRTRAGIAVTAPARSLLDFAATASDPDLERAFAEAQVRRLVSHGELRAAADRAPRRAGGPRIRALLASDSEPALTRSDGERRMLRLVRDSGLPPPLTNKPMFQYVVDFFWPQHDLIVEVDGYRFHSSPRSFESDRRRDAILEAAGYRVMRVTRKQLEDEPVAVAVRLAQALAAQQHAGPERNQQHSGPERNRQHAGPERNRLHH